MLKQMPSSSQIAEPFQLSHDNANDIKINWDYYCIYLMIIHAVCEMLSQSFGDKSRVTSQTGFPYYTLLTPEN